VLPLAVDASARPIVDERGATSIPGVYAGDDIVRGAATVVDAIGDGLLAAEAIDRACVPQPPENRGRDRRPTVSPKGHVARPTGDDQHCPPRGCRATLGVTNS
jgi:pyruvate/2-oxoglutarate dehydrogenase complex dihydrolipoamide dehydrogenase (E3) component